MKKSIKNTISLVAVLFAFSSFCFAQEELSLARSWSLSFDNESEKAEVKVKMTDEYNYMKFIVNSSFTKGKMLVELIDPNGKKQGNFTVKAYGEIKKGKNTNSKSRVAGNMQKAFKHPLIGTWIIRAIPSSATGELQINVQQQFLPKIDYVEIKDSQE